MFAKLQEKSVDFMKAHPKFTKGFVSGSTALALMGSSAVAASAEGESAAEASGDVVDTVVESMSTSLSGVAAKVIPAAVGIGVIFVAASLAWRWFKKMAK